MNSISDAIDNDLQDLENDVASSFESHGEGYIFELKEFCGEIDQRINTDYREETEKCARLDLAENICTMSILTENNRSYVSGLTAIQAELRKARSSTL